jgi:hypothetical protein
MPTIIRFDDLAANTPVSNQFQDKGIIFTEGPPAIIQGRPYPTASARWDPYPTARARWERAYSLTHPIRPLMGAPQRAHDTPVSAKPFYSG